MCRHVLHALLGMFALGNLVFQFLRTCFQHVITFPQAGGHMHEIARQPTQFVVCAVVQRDVEISLCDRRGSGTQFQQRCSDLATNDRRQQEQFDH